MEKIFLVKLILSTPNNIGKKIKFNDKALEIGSAVLKFNRKFDFKEVKIKSIENQEINLLFYISLASEEVPVSYRDLTFFSKIMYYDHNWKQYSYKTSSLFKFNQFIDITDKYIQNFSNVPVIPKSVINLVQNKLHKDETVESSYLTAFENRRDLKVYNENALMLFALQIKLQIEDIHAIAAEALTGRNDKKADLIFVDCDSGIAVIAQGYFSQNSSKKEAPSNKASDLNTATTWLLNRDISELPDDIRSATIELRSAITEGKINSLNFWYVHNLNESKNVKDELKSVEITAQNALNSHFPENAKDISISALEVGKETLEEWYQSLTTPILVSDHFKISVQDGFMVKSDNWEAYVTSIPATWLFDIYTTYKDDLFSANPRNYLGSRNSDKNINFGIKSTMNTAPGDFWAFNNGLTILVHNLTPPEDSDEKVLEIEGISIINGAQTTGAIGSSSYKPSEEMKVPARFVVCNNFDTIQKIIKFNNSQNKLEPADFRSNDSIQNNLRNDFDSMPDVSYNGGKRGGYENIIRRPQNLLPSDSVAQALTAFVGDPIIAYNDKAKIWIDDNIYGKIFNSQTTAEHIIFVYSLLSSINKKKVKLIDKYNNNYIEFTDMDNRQLEFFRLRGSNYLLVTAISKSLEIILNKRITNTFRLEFKDTKSLNKAEDHWEPIVEIASSFCGQLNSAVINGLKSKEKVENAIDVFTSIFESTKQSNHKIYKKFADSCIIN